MRNALAICELRGGYLYEHFPDIIQEGFCTNTEMELWERYYTEKKDRNKAGI